MITRHVTYCDFHLGDNLFHLHFLRALAIQNPQHRFIHGAHQCHLAQLQEVVAGLSNVFLEPLSAVDRSHAHDAWKNAGAGTPAGGFFEKHPERNDYYPFYLDWFKHLAAKMGFYPVFERVEDLLFDYPALLNPTKLSFDYPALLNPTKLSYPFDILFVNSQPCSGQFPPMNSDHGEYLSEIIRELRGRHRIIVTQPTARARAADDRSPRDPWEVEGVVCTQDYGLSVTGIGNISRFCHTIIMIGTGPAWPTMNIFNHGRVQRIILFDPEFVSGFDAEHATNREELREILVRTKLL